MQSVRYSPADERAIMATLWSPSIKNNPLNFVLYAYPWGKEGTPLAKHKGPRRWQAKLLMDMAAHIKNNSVEGAFEVYRRATKSGRGPGKSAVVSWLSHWMVSTRIGSSVIISANTENQLRSVTWAEMSKWFAMAINSHWWEIAATRITPSRWIADLVEEDLKIGSRYWNIEGKLWSAENPDGYAGPHNPLGMMIIFDEASGIDDAIWPVAGGMFTETVPDRFWLAFSNPRRNSGYFFECFNSKIDFWMTETIDCRTVEGTDQGYYQQIIGEYGPDSYEAYVEVYGEFPPEDAGQFIPLSLCRDAVARPPVFDDTAPVIIGIDPAGGGPDTTAIVVRQGQRILDIVRHRGDNTMEIVGIVIEMIEQYDPEMTCMDEGGLGKPLCDRLKEQGYHIRNVNFGWKARIPYGNKRAEMWGEMKQWLKTATIPDDKRLIVDFTMVSRKPDSKGKTFLQSKDTMSASPDSADALALTFAFPVRAKEKIAKKQNKNYFSVTSAITSWLAN